MVDFDLYRVIRNEKALAHHRARMAGAWRAGMPFLVFPFPLLILPEIALSLARRWTPHLSLWMFLVFMAVWAVLLLAPLTYGLHRRARYLREHPEL